jgi:hypothetical protein
MGLHKDEILDRLAEVGNVAQFVALRPERGCLSQSYNRISGRSPNEPFPTAREAIAALLAGSVDGTINVRSYVPDDPRSREFVYALPTVDAAFAAVERLAAEGLHLIVNETVDIGDGGVSGVVQGGTIEFSPDDTPRCVEKPGTASLPFDSGVAMLATVYGFRPSLESAPGERTEFSIHPRARGWRGSHTLLWEHETGVSAVVAASLRWPNRFSRMLGDKAFGLLVADRIGLAVPRTLVIGRRVAPFTFGRPTGSAEFWTRTCPHEPQPGLYATVKGWVDPFKLLSAEDGSGTAIASVLRQDAVRARHSGAAIVGPHGTLIIEGRRGEGDRLMLGIDRPEVLPREVIEAVEGAFSALSARLGPVRFEWVHDGDTTWIVQLHRGGTQTIATTIVPGEARCWLEFYVENGLEQLRATLDHLPDGAGLTLVGEVGLTSHVADIIRRAGAPARLASPASDRFQVHGRS